MSAEPFEVEDFLASAAEALKIRGDARSLAVMLAGSCDFQIVDQDFGNCAWMLAVSLPTHVFHALAPEDKAKIEESLLEVGSPFFSCKESDYLRSVRIFPAVTTAPDGWREEALKFIRGEGITNQGRVRSDNIASKQHKGLLFRSAAEIELFEALQRAKLAVAPLPVFVRVGRSYHRLEPDFVVVFKGLTFVVEVDGDTFHHETPAEADKRLVPLTYEGVEVRRIRAEDITSSDRADAAVADLVQFMNSRKSAR